MYPKSKILFSFGYLLVSFVYSKVFHLWLRIIFHFSLYLYPKVVFKYIGRSIRFREQRSRRNQLSQSYCQRSTYVVVCVTKLYVDQYEMKLSRKNQCSD